MLWKLLTPRSWLHTSRNTIRSTMSFWQRNSTVRMPWEPNLSWRRKLWSKNGRSSWMILWKQPELKNRLWQRIDWIKLSMNTPIGWVTCRTKYRTWTIILQACRMKSPREMASSDKKRVRLMRGMEQSMDSSKRSRDWTAWLSREACSHQIFGTN